MTDEQTPTKEQKESKIFDTPDLGCNKNLDRGLCGEISFANKIILCDDCVFKLIEENKRLRGLK